jgi:hypothetical protein
MKRISRSEKAVRSAREALPIASSGASCRRLSPTASAPSRTSARLPRGKATVAGDKDIRMESSSSSVAPSQQLVHRPPDAMVRPPVARAAAGEARRAALQLKYAAPDFRRGVAAHILTRCRERWRGSPRPLGCPCRRRPPPPGTRTRHTTYRGTRRSAGSPVDLPASGTWNGWKTGRPRGCPGSGKGARSYRFTGNDAPVLREIFRARDPQLRAGDAHAAESLFSRSLA